MNSIFNWIIKFKSCFLNYAIFELWQYLVSCAICRYLKQSYSSTIASESVSADGNWVWFALRNEDVNVSLWIYRSPHKTCRPKHNHGNQIHLDMFHLTWCCYYVPFSFNYITHWESYNVQTWIALQHSLKRSSRWWTSSLARIAIRIN